MLAYLGLDVLVAGIEIAQVPLERVDLIEREVSFAERLHAFHDIEQPPACLQRLIPEEKRSLPFRKDKLLGANEAVLHDVNLAGFRDAAEQYF